MTFKNRNSSVELNCGFIILSLYLFSEKKLCIVPLQLSIDHPRYQHSHKRGNRDAHQTGHHKTMIQKVFANDSGAGAVEIDGCNIARIIRDEEVSINARQHAQQNGSRNAQRIR